MKMVVNVKSTACNILERTDTLMRFYEDIRKYPVLSRDDEYVLLKRFKEGNAEEREKAKTVLVNSNQRFVVAVAKKFATNDNLMDLINEGNIGLLEALDTYDINKNVKFASWAVWYIRRNINMYCINDDNLIRKTNANQTYHKLAQATNLFVQKEHRQPTADELVNLLHDEFNAQVKNYRDVIDTKTIYIDEVASTDDNCTDFPDIMLYNSVTANQNDYEKETENEFNKELVSNMLSKLTVREQEIIRLSFGIGYDRSYELQEIAEKIGFTKERIRQLRGSALIKLKDEFKRVIDKM